ncbi:MAG: hypothetical protein ACR2O4_05880, partial [Hyphomicrobiaceae bacterium]
TVNRRMTNVACDTFKVRMSKTVDDVYQYGVRRQHAFDRADYQRRRYQKCLRPGADTSWRIAQRDSRRAILRRSADRPPSRPQTREPIRTRQVQGESRKTEWRQNGGGAPGGERMLDGSVLAGAGLVILLIGGGWFFFVTGQRSGLAAADTEDRSDWMDRAFENVQMEADTMKRTVNAAGQPSRRVASSDRKAGAAPVFGRRSGPQPQS